MRTGRTWQAVTLIAISDDTTRAAILTRFGVAVGTGEFAIGPMIVTGANANVSVMLGRAEATVLTRRAIAEIHFDLAVTAHIPGFAVAVIVVDQLYAVLSAGRGTRIRQAFVDITLASWPDETGRALAFEATDFVGAGAVIVARGHHAIVDVDLAYETESAGWTRAREVVDQIVTSTTILAGVRPAVVDVEFAVLPLEALSALALIRADEVLAGRAVLTWRRVALVYLLLAVRASVTVEAMATVTVAYVFAGAVVAKTVFRHALSYGGVLARDHLHVAYLAGPSG